MIHRRLPGPSARKPAPGPKALAVLLPAALALVLACGNKGAPNPYGPDGGPDGGPGGQGGAGGGGGSGGLGGSTPDGGNDPTLGGPCLDNGQCDDHLPCTFDRCDHALGRCRFTPDDSRCQDSAYCDGVERCDNKLGCVAGVPIGCEDGNSCTIDACIEQSRKCAHAPRDVDQDGDPDGHCYAGRDCDDGDPTVSSLMKEICGNGKDDNCNGKVDEMPCVSPSHDTCLDPLSITAPGSYAMSTVGAHFDYPTTCGFQNQGTERDVVAAITLPPGATDVQVTARSMAANVAVTLAGQCGDPATQLACGGSYPSPFGGTLAKLLAHGLASPPQAAVLPLYVTTDQPAAVTLDVQFLPATPAPVNETCGTAAPITPGVPVTAPIINPALDLATACGTALGELVYSFTLAAPANVDVFASSSDGDGFPAISLRDAGCALPGDELTCNVAQDAHVFRHGMAPGTYFVSVSATAPSQIAVTLEVSAPTALPPNQSCNGAPVLAPNKTIGVDLTKNQDGINLGCLPGAVDAAYELDLVEASDVLLVERISAGDVGAVELSRPACAGPADALACGNGGQSPVRSARHDLAPGSYRAVVESLQGEPAQLTAFVRPAVPPTLIPFADNCGEVVDLPATGGLFQGNTANQLADFAAGCDEGGLPPGGAKDQILRLTLAKTQRVVLDMNGSGYNTLLDVRKGPGCPGTEVAMGCAIGFPPERSYLDLTLGAGVYYLQIDGFALDAGAWFLDVRVVDP